MKVNSESLPDSYADSEMYRDVVTGFEEMEFFALYKGVGVLYLTEWKQLFTHDLAGNCYLATL